MSRNDYVLVTLNYGDGFNIIIIYFT